MNSRFLFLALCPLLTAPGPLKAAPAQVEPMPGSYQAVDTSNPDVLDAKAAIQAHLTDLTIQAVHAAYVQVVAGTNYKLVCQVSGASGSATWVFVVWHKLDGQWQLDLAKRI
jgi:hypothetical protein